MYLSPLLDIDPFGVKVARGATRRPVKSKSVESGERSHAAGSGARVPLRSKTVISRRFQLQTYTDSSSIQEALRRLKQMCGPLPLDDEEEMRRFGPDAFMSSETIRSQINRLPGHVVVHCFTFCDLPSLAALSRVSRRFAAFANAHHIWVAHALRLNKPINAPETARRDLRHEIQERWDMEVLQHELECEELERRLHDRATAERAETVDVDRVLGNHVRSSLSSVRSRGGTFRRGINMGGIEVANESGSTFHNNGGTDNENRSTMGGRHCTEELRALQAQVEQLESVKRELLNSVRDIKSTLAEQQTLVHDLQRRLTAPVNHDSSPTELTMDIVNSFERRICRIVLGPVSDLPLVLRRGVDDFGSMELLLQHDCGEASVTVRKRWDAFKRFFPPVSNDYSTVRARLLAGAPPKSEREHKALTDVGKLINRLQKMSDKEIMDIVM
ncbi:F box domain [Trypanosoma vivax]|uniref:F-box domain-containing protein n=1 Tax=Trypanosoma vivax (strain Y486) TaxID=1055687 RepID=G0TU61_TRYVY|nr:hypothetical protein TRVL_06756 [Trypanosoma vivax]KAH8607414.1 F box domain [Trypanosoma vivax]CCC47495.1 conserved hypothetical protein [Trypanosoma vivax Y486]